MTDATTSLLIVDSQKLVTDLITAALNSSGEFLVSSANSVAAAIDVLKSAASDQFDIILLETDLGKGITVSEVGQIAKLSAPAKLVLFSNQADKPFVDSCVQVAQLRHFAPDLSLSGRCRGQ